MPTTEYDISRAFKRIENELIDSMMRNMKRHQVEEAELGKEWEQWQAIQLAELEEYRKKNAQLFSGDFTDIQDKIDDLFYATYNDAQSAEEHRLMDRIKKGDFKPTEDKGSFFRLNEPKLNALIMATQADFARAEYAMLRRANDQYRKIIFDSMAYANVTNDYAKAVDMATHDFLKAGINSVVYKNGARHTVADYAYMALRTGNKRAYLMGEGNAHDRYGLHTVRVNKRTHACPKCVGFLGRLLIDDVYGGGTRAEANAKGIPTLSDAMQAGFLHPNCKDIYSAYIEGVSQPAKPWTQEEVGEIVGEYNQEQQLKHAEDMKDSYERMAKYSLDPTNQQTYQARADNWQARIDELKNTPPISVEATLPMPSNAITELTMLQDTVKGSQPMKDLVSYATTNKVDFRTVNPLPKRLTEEEIIQRIAGGDMTQGSCVSLACAFAGNINGYDVLDFRGGNSLRMFWRNSNNRKLCDLTGVVSKKVMDFNDMKAVKQLFDDMVDDRLYILCTGKHASIVRKQGGVAQYLELQSATKSGWHNFDSNTLKRRFGCQKTHTIAGTKYESLSYTIDVDSLYNNKEFNNLLGYINTAEDKQKKGALGSVK